MNVIILRPTETVFECYKEYGMKKLSMSEDADDYLETKLFYDPYCDRVNNSVAAWITRFTEIRTTPRTNTYLYDYRTQYHAHGISLIETSQMHFFKIGRAHV